MPILSKLALTLQYGRYVDFVPSKKGCCTPVKRSCRNTARETPHHTKCKETNVPVNDGRDDSAHSIKKEPLKPSALDIDNLCTIFQQTLMVDNHSLEVKHSESNVCVLSPEPKVGRFVTAKDSNDSAIFTPVKRSTRNVEDQERSVL
eukprot:scaffold2473_cov214-Chaetoceros_neogracile.AAC.16